MKKSILHNTIIIFTLLLVALCFNFSVKASNLQVDTNKKQITSSLVLKSKNAIIAGNPKMAESYLEQAKSIDPTLNAPEYFKNDTVKESIIERNDVQSSDEFFDKVQSMPYDKAKIELDKRLLFNPNNSKIRLVYLELAEKNNDESEANIHRSFLGIQKPKFHDIDLMLKYFLIALVSILIIYEIISIFKPVKVNNQQVQTN